MPADESFTASVAWLIQPPRARERQVLSLLHRLGPLTAPEIQDILEIKHPQTVYRSVEYLADRGFVDKSYHFREGADAQQLHISPLGVQGLKLATQAVNVLRGESFLEVADIKHGPKRSPRRRSVKAQFTKALSWLADAWPVKQSVNSSASNEESTKDLVIHY